MNSKNIEIKPIQTDADYRRTLKQVEALMDGGTPGTQEAEVLEVLAILVAEYENKHFPVEAPDPVEAIKYRMEQLNLTQKDLAKYPGGENSVSEIFNKKRPLTLKMINLLHHNLHIPAETLFAG